ncbi:MAG: alkaline phosphatase family protein [Pseudomonadota bacterium]
MKNSTILIGLDGATFSILDQLMQDDTMPFLKGFIAQGMRAELLSVVPPLTPPAWTSLVTGRSPGHHGIFDFFQKQGDNHYVRFTTSKDVHCETIWAYANRHGKRVTSLNFPLMLPPPALNGNVISGGWMTWRQLRLGCYPDELYLRLKAVPGFNPRELAMDLAHEEKAIEGCREDEYEGWITMHIRREQQWFNIARHLMQEDPCDLTAVLFDGVDKLQHLCWRFLDRGCFPEHPSAWEQKIRNLCRDYFRQLDTFLAEIALLAGPEATIVMASDHGFGAQKETFFVNAWLEQQGYLAWAGSEQPREETTATLGIAQLASHAYRLDWEKTRAYAATPSSNGIHIVAADSTHAGGVSKEEYAQFRKQLCDRLSGLVSPKDNEKMISRIWTREEAFNGEYMHLAPDLTLRLRDGGMVSILASDTVIKPREITGTHRPEGILLARGPGIRKGLSHRQLSILDTAPLVLYCLGLPVPDDMEGRVPAEIFEPSLLERQPVVIGKASQPVAAAAEQSKEESGYDDETEAIIAARLRDLGYIE